MRARAEVKLVIYYDQAESAQSLRDMLEAMVRTVANRGEMSSSEGPEIIETWHCDIDIKPLC